MKLKLPLRLLAALVTSFAGVTVGNRYYNRSCRDCRYRVAFSGRLERISHLTAPR